MTARLVVLVCYDVRDAKRWRRIFSFLKKRGVHRQLSVFELKVDWTGFERLKEELSTLIDPAQDSLLLARVQPGGSCISDLGVPGPSAGPDLVII